MPPNNTYINFERFARVVEDLAGAEGGLGALALSRHALQEDLDALVSIYDEKEAWYREEHEKARHELSQLKYEFRKIESLKKHLHEDIRAVGTGLAGVAGRYRDRLVRYEALSRELAEGLQWAQELAGGLPLEGGGHPSAAGNHPAGVFSKDLHESLMELLNRSCCEEFLAALSPPGAAKSSQ